MTFAPYHHFGNCRRLEQIVENLKTSGNMTQDAYDNFNRYHPAFMHKMRAAKYNLQRLEEKLTTADIAAAATSTGELMFEANLFIDGFFYNSGSALDILARIILTLFGQALTANIYFQSAFNILSQTRTGDAILDRIQEPRWKALFSDYRNTLTHELILAPRLQIDIDTSGGNPSRKIVLPLPDDPRAAPPDRRYRQNPDVLKYIKSHFKRILTLANTVYGDIVTRAGSQGSLPL